MDYYALFDVRISPVSKQHGEGVEALDCRKRTSTAELSVCTAVIGPYGRQFPMALVQVPPNAKPPEIKAAYRRLQKQCHPDILGAEFGHDMSITANQVILWSHWLHS